MIKDNTSSVEIHAHIVKRMEQLSSSLQYFRQGLEAQTTTLKAGTCTAAEIRLDLLEADAAAGEVIAFMGSFRSVLADAIG